METFLDEGDRDATARQLLKKAYVWMNFGYYQRAMQVCEYAAERADDPFVARTLHGAILTASGRALEGMRMLMKLHRRRRDAILTALYLAEACFLAGRPRRGFKTLDSIDRQALEDSPFEPFARQLRETWENIDEVQPLEVPLEERSDARSRTP